MNAFSLPVDRPARLLLIALPAAGGSPTTLDLVDAIGDRYFGTLAGVHVLPGDTDAVARYVPLSLNAKSRSEEEEVVEVRQAPLRAEAADVVDALPRGTLDLGDRRAVEEVRLAEVPGPRALDRHQYAPALSILKL